MYKIFKIFLFLVRTGRAGVIFAGGLLWKPGGGLVFGEYLLGVFFFDDCVLSSD
jgi:hypothetical protein